jgi:D-alanyl-D-alanine carboxypeptidase
MKGVTQMRRLSLTDGSRLILLALASMSAATLVAGCGGENEHHVSSGLSAQLQQIVVGAVKSPTTVFPGTALYVSQPGLGTWSGAAGEGDIDPATPMKAEDTFRAGSILKPFISTVVLQLVEEGKLSLDDVLSAVLPRRVTGRFPDAAHITVRMLLDHTSGIPDYANSKEFEGKVLADPRRHWKVSEFLDRAAAQAPTFPPGKGWGYSNTDYNLLGLVIEQATGKPWRAAVRERIIDRLGLKHTSLPDPGRNPIRSDAAHGYELVNGKLRDVSDVDPSMADAAGGDALATTTADLAHFINSLLAGQLFERANTLKEMLTFVDAKGAPGLVGYGLGLERYELPGGVVVIGHAGGTAGYLSFVGHLPAQDIDVAMVINNRDDPTPVLIPALKLMVAKSS